MAREQNRSEGFIFKYVLTCAAATVAETVTYPLDLTKTRLQIQGENWQGNSSSSSSSSSNNLNQISNTTVTPKQRGMMGIASDIVRNEGFLKLWQGLVPAVLRHYLYTGIRVGVYEKLRENIFHRNPDGTFSFYKALISGGVGGAIAQLVASPTDLIKVQMQMEGYRRSLGHSPRVHSMYHAFKTTASATGIPGLWRGWVPNCQRAALVNMADLATYDTIKHWFLMHTNIKDNMYCHALSSAFAGLAAALVSTPSDVIKTRIMNQPHDGTPLLYRGSVDCFMRTVKAEGLFALYKGFVPIWARMAPWSTTFWVSYEQIRKMVGASSF